jgi:RimJ/RimL family protein N-acetyltransferase
MTGGGSATGRQFDGAGATATVSIETMAWPTIEALEAGRVRLEPLAVDYAVPMVEVLANPALYEFIGGHPPTPPELQRRYAAQTVGHSDDQTQWWLNWIVVLRDGACAIGYVQATVEHRAAALEASIAWVIAPDFQGHGLATEAAGAMLDWLKGHGVGPLVAYVHPCHAASQAVARKLGLRPTWLIEDGEVRWQSSAH